MLYRGYTAFILKGVPYDVAELSTYSQMTDIRAKLDPRNIHLAPEIGDLVIGEMSHQLGFKRLGPNLGLAVAPT